MSEILPDAERTKLLAKAQERHDQGSWREAALGYGTFVAAGGDAGDIAAAHGDVLVEAGLPEEALAVYARGSAARPEDAALALRLGRVAQQLGHLGVARSATRAGARVAADGSAGAVGGETPLPLRLTASTRRLLQEAGWPLHPAGLDRPAPPGAGDAAGEAGRELPLERVEPLPRQEATRLVASVVARDGRGAAADVLRLAEAAEASAPGAAVLLLHLPAGGGEGASALSLRARGLPVVTTSFLEPATDLQLHTLSLQLARALGADALIARDAPLGDSPEVARAFAPDPMVGFATLTAEPSDRAAPSAWTYGPAVVGPWLWVRDRVLQEAGLPDSVFETLDPALLDLMLRANRMGFSTVSAPARFVASPPRREVDAVDDRIVVLRYPEHAGCAARVATGARAEADRLLRGLDAPRSLALDLTSLRPWHDGTAALGVALARALARDGRFDVSVLCSPQAARHHGLDADRALSVVDIASRPVAAACLKVGQPFTWDQLLAPWSVAPLAGFYMLDAISLDVERLNAPVDLDPLWRVAFGHSELVGHLSRYTRDQMAARFGDSGGRGFVALCSTAADEYAHGEPSVGGAGPVVLVGNAYEHKNLLGAVRAIHAREPQRELVVLGRVLQPRPHVRWLDSGTLTHPELERLYRDAAAIVFPSLYEGFGLPIMHGLAHRRPVLAIDQPVFREIQARTRWAAGLHLFPTTDALAQGLDAVCRRGFPAAPAPVREHRWADAARIVGDAVVEAQRRFDSSALDRRVGVSQLIERAWIDAGAGR